MTQSRGKRNLATQKSNDVVSDDVKTTTIPVAEDSILESVSNKRQRLDDEATGNDPMTGIEKTDDDVHSTPDSVAVVSLEHKHQQSTATIPRSSNVTTISDDGGVDLGSDSERSLVGVENMVRLNAATLFSPQQGSGAHCISTNVVTPLKSPASPPTANVFETTIPTSSGLPPPKLNTTAIDAPTLPELDEKSLNIEKPSKPENGVTADVNAAIHDNDSNSSLDSETKTDSGNGNKTTGAKIDKFWFVLFLINTLLLVFQPKYHITSLIESPQLFMAKGGSPEISINNYNDKQDTPLIYGNTNLTTNNKNENEESKDNELVASKGNLIEAIIDIVSDTVTAGEPIYDTEIEGKVKTSVDVAADTKNDDESNSKDESTVTMDAVADAFVVDDTQPQASTLQPIEVNAPIPPSATAEEPTRPISSIYFVPGYQFLFR